MSNRATSVEGVVEELYALPPRDFTAARDAEVRRLRSAGERERAGEVAALRKPTVAAWLANRLVREHPDEVGPLLELGAALREATETLSGPQLRDLSRRRGQLVQALVRQARRLAAEAGQAVSEEAAGQLEQTLGAALADEQAGEQLRAGRLTEALRHTGFGPGSTAGAPRERPRRAAKASRRTGGSEDRARAQRRAALEKELAAAWAAARDAADARAGAESAADGAERAAADAQRTVDRLRAQTGAAQAQLEQAARQAGEARAARDAARDEAQRATRRVTELQREIDQA